MSQQEESNHICTFCAQKFPLGTEHHCRLEGIRSAYDLVISAPSDSLLGYAWRVRIRCALLRAMMENPQQVMPGAALQYESLRPMLDLSTSATPDCSYCGGLGFIVVQSGDDNFIPHHRDCECCKGNGLAGNYKEK